MLGVRDKVKKAYQSSKEGQPKWSFEQAGYTAYDTEISETASE